MFERYLAERGFESPEHEPDLGIGVRPEYLLERNGHRCLTEVKEFALESNPIRASGSYSQQQTLKPIRGQIHSAARKLREAKGLKLPLVVVLTDPRGALVGLMRPIEIIAAMRGDLTVVALFTGPAQMAAGRNGELRNDHPYVSAVVGIEENFLSGKHRADTFITNSPGAEPLSPVFFTGDGDSLYEYSAQTGTYVLREFAGQ